MVFDPPFLEMERSEPFKYFQVFEVLPSEKKPLGWLVLLADVDKLSGYGNRHTGTLKSCYKCLAGREHTLRVCQFFFGNTQAPCKTAEKNSTSLENNNNHGYFWLSVVKILPPTKSEVPDLQALQFFCCESCLDCHSSWLTSMCWWLQNHKC